ncbi:hypothetical protein ABW19_dt0201182 [Dactylella cylindrospora]|nr:hypothetical protein ABW19_dt0201182 [Dactylella cylindrospora]
MKAVLEFIHRHSGTLKRLSLSMDSSTDQDAIVVATRQLKDTHPLPSSPKICDLAIGQVRKVGEFVELLSGCISLDRLTTWRSTGAWYPGPSRFKLPRRFQTTITKIHIENCMPEDVTEILPHFTAGLRSIHLELVGSQTYPRSSAFAPHRTTLKSLWLGVRFRQGIIPLPDPLGPLAQDYISMNVYELKKFINLDELAVVVNAETITDSGKPPWPNVTTLRLLDTPLKRYLDIDEDSEAAREAELVDTFAKRQLAHIAAEDGERSANLKFIIIGGTGYSSVPKLWCVENFRTRDGRVEAFVYKREIHEFAERSNAYWPELNVEFARRGRRQRPIWETVFT